jgi:GR25 family glycosyltransferase involved in LPS biosynthesis
MRATTPFRRVRNVPTTTKKKISKQLRVEVDSCKPKKKVLAQGLQKLSAIVVNLDRRPDRLVDCQKKLTQHCPWLDHERFRASDGKLDIITENDVTSSWNTAKNVQYQKLRATRKGWNDLESYKVKTLDHSPGERGCSASHIRAWKYCLDAAGDTEKPLLVLEDDASPTENFTEVLERALAVLPGDAHILYLGYSQAADWRREISADVVEAEYVWTTVGYIIWPAGARVLLSRLPVDQPVDNWMATACAAGAVKSYCVRPKIIRQADEWNVNSDVGHSDEVDSDIKHSDVFYPGLRADAVEGDILFGTGSDTSDDDDDDLDDEITP